MLVGATKFTVLAHMGGLGRIASGASGIWDLPGANQLVGGANTNGVQTTALSDILVSMKGVPMTKDEQPRTNGRSPTARSGRERAIGVSVGQGEEPGEVALSAEGSLRAAVTAVDLAQGSSAFPTGRDASHTGVLGLQRCIGNRAVAQLFRPASQASLPRPSEPQAAAPASRVGLDAQVPPLAGVRGGQLLATQPPAKASEIVSPRASSLAHPGGEPRGSGRLPSTATEQLGRDSGDGARDRKISVQRKFAEHQYPNVEAFAGGFKKELDQLPFAKRRACYEALRNDTAVFSTAEEIRGGIASWRLANGCPLPARATQDANMPTVSQKLNLPAQSAPGRGSLPSPKAPSSTASELRLLPPVRPAPSPSASASAFPSVSVSPSATTTSSSSSFSAPNLEAPPSIAVTEAPPSIAVTSDKAEPSGIGQLVRAALAGLSGAQLSKEVILERLTKAFGGTAQLHEASKRPELAEALLEEVRGRQSSTWIRATELHQARPKAWASEKERQKWNVRHYTNKVTVVLGEEVDADIFKVADVKPPPFSELLSSITLATMPGTAKETGYKKGGELLMANTSAASTSGHTTVKDWKNIGNVGDTFYGLFYEDKPATGVTPPFIKDAVYFARWSLSDFGTGWASADWLATAAESQTEGAKTPGGKAWKGDLANIITEIFPMAAKSEAQVSGTESERQRAFNAMDNFEIKKHGPMKVAEWLPVEDNIKKIKGWSVNPKKGTFVKLVHSFK